MMKQALLLIIVFSVLQASSQTWVKIPNSDITYSNFWATAGDDQYKIKFEYFKKGDDLLVVERFQANNFYNILSFTPVAFDSIFSNAMTICYKENMDKKFSDSLIKNINYHRAFLLTNMKVVVGYKEIIWIMKNTGPCSSSNPCYLNIIFQKEHDRPNKIRFVKAMTQYCEI